MRTLLLFLLFGYTAFGLITQSACIQKIDDSDSLKNATLSLPVTQTTRLLFSTKKPHAEIIKSDPLLGLYLIKSKKQFAFPFVFTRTMHKDLYAVTAVSAKPVMLLHPQVGLRLAVLREPLHSLPALLISGCCDVNGIITKEGVIESSFITHFLKVKHLSYATLGITVDPSLHIVLKNPFLASALQLQDKILTLDGKRILSEKEFADDVLYGEIGSKHSIEILRHGMKKRIDVTLYKKLGGGVQGETFLEYLGLYFSSSLHLLHGKKFGLLPGDKIVAVNGQKVFTQSEVAKALCKQKTAIVLLIQRDGFQFFVHIN
jgi:hypothetical protein